MLLRQGTIAIEALLGEGEWIPVAALGSARVVPIPEPAAAFRFGIGVAG